MSTDQSFRTIPMRWEYTCSLCGRKHIQTAQKELDRPFSSLCPKDWIRVKMVSNGTKFSYPAEPIERLFCSSCGELAIKALETLEPPDPRTGPDVESS